MEEVCRCLCHDGQAVDPDDTDLNCSICCLDTEEEEFVEASY
jgi:hypothetical protein